MDMTNEKETLRIRKRVFWILHFAFVVAVVIYFFMSYFFLRPETLSGAATSNTHSNLLSRVLIVLSMVTAVGGYFIPSFVKWPGCASESALARLMARQTQMIVTDAFFESIAIFGVIGVFLGMGQGMRWGLMALSFILLVLQIPRYRVWLDELGGSAREPGRGGRW